MVGFDVILKEFERWFDEAKVQPSIVYPEAMNLATIGADGAISSRIVLMKRANLDGFTFFTNYQSHKSADMSAHSQVALCFYWQPLGKQIRIQGRVQKVSDSESDAYFATRPRESQIGAWASAQSAPVESREVLMEKFRLVEAQFEGKPVPRPPHWGGWLVVPDYVEFWQEGDHRLHDREVFTKQADGMWNKQRLNP